VTSPSRHAEIGRLFLAACERQEEDRARFLDEACGSDLDLRRQVDALLAYHTERSLCSQRGDFVASPLPQAERHKSGEVFAGRYRIVSLLGHGGMGEVYRAEDLTLGVPVALKFLRAGSSPHREALLNEVRLARQVSHPAVCRVFDVAEAEGQTFVTMEYIEGEDLASELRRIGRLPAAKVLELAHELCAGLAVAHDCGVLHRDLKPANVMLDAGGHARIVDFGIAIREGVPDLVRVGTPAYMAPEQLVPGRRATAQTDLYALGLLLYEMATGRPVFRAQTLAERSALQSSAALTPPSTWVPEIDPRLERVILGALQEDPRKRPASARAMAELLEESAQGPDAGASAALPSAARPRRLAAILSADVAGYSRLMAEDEEATVRTVTAYRETVELLVAQHRGRLVDFTGDNFLAEFPSALDAVRGVLELQRVLAARNAELPPERRMQFRMGIHLGEVRVEGERLFGTGVNVAARLEGLAEPGGVCISAAVYAQLQGKLEALCEDLGEHSVKNIPEPVRVYRVPLDRAAFAAEASPQVRRRRLGSNRPGRWLAATVVLLALIGFGVWSRHRPAELAPIRSIAVLPLENLSGDPEQEYFADGMTEALIGDLARIGALNIISRTSVMQYKGDRKPLPQIARELDVEGIIEGTVMRVGDRVRITAQLIDARTDRHLWTDRFDRDLSDVLLLQADVAHAVAEQVRLELTLEERAGLASRTVDPAAYDAYLRGRARVGSWGNVGRWAPQAIEHFERAVELDPGLAEAWAWVANVRMSLGNLGLNLRDREQYPRAREAAQRALDLDDHLGMAHAVLGYILMQNAWDFAGAKREFERAIELSPGDPTVVNGLAWYLLLTGKTEQGLALS